MSDYTLSSIYPSDSRSMRLVRQLLEAEGIRQDKNLDYTCALFDDDMNVIATGSCFGNTLRCLAVSKAHQGEALMNQILTHLIEVQYERGNFHLFLYTKCNSAPFFRSLGFYEIARIPDQIVFMENRKTGFSDYLKKLETEAAPNGGSIAALVMNANPFTLGHQYLVEKAAAENDLVHLFLVSEDASLVPFAVRKKLVQEGTAHLSNVVLHDSGPYIISSATFPSYFQKDESAVIESHAMIDLTVFTQIAQRLQITRRYVGEEPFSLVTGIYNRIMSEKLPEQGIECVIVPRKTENDQAISASNVRQAIKDGDLERLKQLVPESTYRYFAGPEGEAVVARIKAEDNVIHY